MGKGWKGGSGVLRGAALVFASRSGVK